MKIALFHNLPSGGAKRTVYEQAARLSQKHTIDLFNLSTADQDFLDIGRFIRRRTTAQFNPGKLFNSPIGRLNMVVRTLDLVRLERAMRALAAEIDGGGYDLALVHPCQISISPAILKYLKTPSLYYRHDVVRWVHDPAIQRPYASAGLRKRLDSADPLIRIYRSRLIASDRSSMQAATETLTNSCFVRESLMRIYGIAPRVCYQGVDENVFRPLGLEREDFVLSVGMIHPFKGFDFLIESLALVEPAERPRLVIVGNQTDNQEQKYLVELADQRKLKVTFRENIALEELVNLYNTARFVAYSPYMESFGLVPLEAMACGAAVLGVREGGVRETIIDGQTGLLAERDPAVFAEAVLRLLDAKLRDQLGAQAREHILERWTMEAAIQRLELEIERTARKNSDRVVREKPEGERILA